MLIKKFFGAMLLLAMLALPQSVSAEKTDWYDRNFNFHRLRNVIVFDVTVNPGLDYGGPIGLRNLQDSFLQNTGRLRCNVITEAQARQMIGYQLGMNLEGIHYSNPLQARQFIMQNAYRIADAWVIANVDSIANNSYVEPSRTVWEQRKETRIYRDQWGNRREETYYVQVPVTYPPRRVDVSAIQMTLQLYDSRNGALVFARKDVRDREDYQAQKGMFDRISNSFFEDVGKRIR